MSAIGMVPQFQDAIVKPPDAKAVLDQMLEALRGGRMASIGLPGVNPQQPPMLPQPPMAQGIPGPMLPLQGSPYGQMNLATPPLDFTGQGGASPMASGGLPGLPPPPTAEEPPLQEPGAFSAETEYRNALETFHRMHPGDNMQQRLMELIQRQQTLLHPQEKVSPMAQLARGLLMLAASRHGLPGVGAVMSGWGQGQRAGQQAQMQQAEFLTPEIRSLQQEMRQQEAEAGRYAQGMTERAATIAGEKERLYQQLLEKRREEAAKPKPQTPAEKQSEVRRNNLLKITDGVMATYAKLPSTERDVKHVQLYVNQLEGLRTRYQKEGLDEGILDANIGMLKADLSTAPEKSERSQEAIANITMAGEKLGLTQAQIQKTLADAGLTKEKTKTEPLRRTLLQEQILNARNSRRIANKRLRLAVKIHSDNYGLASARFEWNQGRYLNQQQDAGLRQVAHDYEIGEREARQEVQKWQALISKGHQSYGITMPLSDDEKSDAQTHITDAQKDVNRYHKKYIEIMGILTENRTHIGHSFLPDVELPAETEETDKTDDTNTSAAPTDTPGTERLQPIRAAVPEIAWGRPGAPPVAGVSVPGPPDALKQSRVYHLGDRVAGPILRGGRVFYVGHDAQTHVMADSAKNRHWLATQRRVPVLPAVTGKTRPAPAAPPQPKRPLKDATGKIDLRAE